jgi:hypothetical protein
MDDAESFGKLVRIEAERRGSRSASTILVMGDGGNWIDPLNQRERLGDRRIVDYYRASEHLYDAGRAAMGRDAPEAKALATAWADHLWNGRRDEVIAELKEHADRLGRPQASDGSGSSAWGAGQQHRLLRDPSASHGLCDVPGQGRAHRFGRGRVGRQAV